ncbi:hypothetical protein NQ016_03955 [Staphylococcus hyicus]|uniref:hypothetical protein n=1 Tax=Staphylococcus hyicus TaxID=1284 RepID=UPI00211CFC2F|nr:hypothetical protein [Staphylococcus hyicus]MCQ9290672.1 hypothetical protein [Staphylococcus hyicus]MCQ9305914.1 hypothetical protein [Staphylococcus hyicus]MCQ9308326.1 hypothetical protein [Staphylococcus hyicus]MCQ9310748.1 hypothetical protein [Staphylococcus hyicus]
MAIQLEIIIGGLQNHESVQKFEDMVNRFLRNHKVINVEYKTNMVQTANSLKQNQIAFISYDDELDKDWKGLFNIFSSGNYELKDILKATLKATDVAVSNETIDKLANYYKNNDLISDLSNKLGIDIELDPNV